MINIKDRFSVYMGLTSLLPSQLLGSGRCSKFKTKIDKGIKMGKDNSQLY